MELSLYMQTIKMPTQEHNKVPSILMSKLYFPTIRFNSSFQVQGLFLCQKHAESLKWTFY